eukprot:5104235-Pyramimonas_sp.AAC.1
MGFNPMFATGQRMQEIALSCSNMDAVLLAGTQASSRRASEVLCRKIGKRVVLEAEAGVGAFTNRSTGCALMLGSKFREQHICQTWA